MADKPPKVRRDLPSLNQSSLREAVAETVSGCRGSWSDQDMADEWGVSAGTVNNAQNKRHDIGLMHFLKLGKRFGADALNTTLALIGAKALNDTEVAIDVSRVPHGVASVLPLLIEVFADEVCCSRDVRKLDEAGAIDAMIEVADFLRQRRDEVRLEDVK